MAEYIEREGLMHELGPYEENNFCQEMSVILQISPGDRQSCGSNGGRGCL